MLEKLLPGERTGVIDDFASHVHARLKDPNEVRIELAKQNGFIALKRPRRRPPARVLGWAHGRYRA